MTMMRHSKTQSTGPLASVEPVLKPGQFEALRDLLAQYSGVYLDKTRQKVLTTGLAQRLAATGKTLETYAAHIAQPAGRAELQHLAELTLNHETIFFRNLPHMRALREVILPEMHRRKPTGVPIRIWSAGCATGEEPYSLAITALETFATQNARPVEIWATDLSELALAKARLGSYRGRSLSNVTPEIRARYFDPRGEAWFVNDRVRSLVRFEQLNLLEPFPDYARGVDIIFCQNVTIYFQLATCRALIERFYQSLEDGGTLFLGFSETLWNVHNGFRLQETHGSFVYYKEPYRPQPDVSTPPVQAPAPSRTSTRVSNSRQTRTPREGRPRTIAPRETSHTPGERPVQPSAKSANASQPSDSDIVQQGHALLSAGQVTEALDMLAQVPLNGPHAPQAVALIARAHANRGDLDLAVAEARRAIELDSLTTEAYLLLGMLYAQQGQLQSAVQHLERARYLDPEAALISFHLAEMYRQIQRREWALREYRNTLRKLATHPPDALLDGVAVRWVRDTCQRYVEILADEQR